MNPRKRLLIVVVLTVAILAVGAFFLNNVFLAPLGELDTSLLKLQQEVAEKELRVAKIEAAKARVERLKELSLPSDVEFSRREYENYLSDLFADSGFPPGSVSITPKQIEKSNLVMPDKRPVYVRLPFTITARATLANLVEMLEQFYRTSLLQQIKTLSIQRVSTTGAQALQAQQGELEIHMVVEGLVVAEAEKRDRLLPALNKRLLALDVVAALRHAPVGLGQVLWAAGPAGPAGPHLLAQPPRQYASIAKKDIFLGNSSLNRPEVVEVARYVHLTDITHNLAHSPPRCEAFFYDRYRNITTRLRPEPGFDRFMILDNDDEVLVRGKVIRLDDREMIFQVDQNQNYYSMHVGQNLDEALKRPLSGEQIKDLGLSAVAEKSSGSN
jgi:hypothetical protein